MVFVGKTSYYEISHLPVIGVWGRGGGGREDDFGKLAGLRPAPFEAGRPPVGAASRSAGLWPASGRPVASRFGDFGRVYLPNPRPKPAIHPKPIEI